jgi:hypothetical protein
MANTTWHVTEGDEFVIMTSSTSADVSGRVEWTEK